MREGSVWRGRRAVLLTLSPSSLKVSGAASKEYSLEKAMDKMEADWAPVEFNTVPFRESG